MKTKTSIDKRTLIIARILLNQYETDYIKVAEEFGKDMYVTMRADLQDKGFTNEEIPEIIYRRFRYTQTSVLKFIAYACSLYEDYKTLDELKDIIKELTSLELTDDDIGLSILEYAEMIS